MSEQPTGPQATEDVPRKIRVYWKSEPQSFWVMFPELKYDFQFSNYMHWSSDE